ncbi:peptidoglycan DD-metalloendopeptidase family protein [Ramlibacter sp.]|uniref:peptidoglycan DD-metalloendopeptidase family protein n=1 Tax=Ramlibacter sp. TaxID=1917967 RepID=UPI002D314CF8|nr:peptidoglycan DD-metalloendopeptidase family protein [Ramlibacter sp.]HYD75719.1 peptidoglycan DD-metalloendopeptidase family protein [Ramlibacter sp.]
MFARTTTRIAIGVVAALVLAGCASRTRAPAPVEDRTNNVRTAPLPPVAAPGVELPKVLPGAENAGKPGYYTVRPGDTLIRIGLETGQNWRDIGRWNNIDNPNVIEVGQVLRVSPPDTVVARPVPPSSVAPAPAASASQPAPAASSPASTASAPASSAPRGTVTTASPGPAASQPPVPAEEEIAWGWPAPGNSSVIGSFDEVRNKGLDIGGKTGDPVLAAADGRVVYAGAGLRGYGNLIILKHNNTYLTAYAHNQTLLVKEDQTVRKGQKIAEMGSTDTDRVKLHFEIRRQGKPVDPARLLPPR